MRIGDALNRTRWKLVPAGDLVLPSDANSDPGQIPVSLLRATRGLRPHASYESSEAAEAESTEETSTEDVEDERETWGGVK